MRKLHAVFHSGCTTLHSHQQWTGLVFSPHPHQHWSFLVFLIIAMRWYLIVGLICISLMIIPVEYLFMYLLAICMTSIFFNWMINSLICTFFFLNVSIHATHFFLGIPLPEWPKYWPLVFLLSSSKYFLVSIMFSSLTHNWSNNVF